MKLLQVISLAVLCISTARTYESIDYIPYVYQDADGNEVPEDTEFVEQADEEVVIKTATEEVVEEEEYGCDLNIFKYSNERSFYNMTYGFVQGLYSTSQYPQSTGCLHCGAVARPIANMQRNIVKLNYKADKYLGDWSSFSSIDQVTELYDLYKVVQNFCANMDNLIQQPATKLIYTQMLQTFDTDYVGQFQNHIVQDGFALTQFFYSSPGADCQRLGVRSGALVRNLFGYQLFADF